MLRSCRHQNRIVASQEAAHLGSLPFPVKAGIAACLPAETERPCRIAGKQLDSLPSPHAHLSAWEEERE